MAARLEEIVRRDPPSRAAVFSGRAALCSSSRVHRKPSSSYTPRSSALGVLLRGPHREGFASRTSLEATLHVLAVLMDPLRRSLVCCIACLQRCFEPEASRGDTPNNLASSRGAGRGCICGFGNVGNVVCILAQLGWGGAKTRARIVANSCMQM